MEVIYIRLEDAVKIKLEASAKKIGLTLTAYCRMVLLKSLEKDQCQK